MSRLCSGTGHLSMAISLQVCVTGNVLDKDDTRFGYSRWRAELIVFGWFYEAGLPNRRQSDCLPPKRLETDGRFFDLLWHTKPGKFFFQKLCFGRLVIGIGTRFDSPPPPRPQYWNKLHSSHPNITTGRKSCTFETFS